MLYIRALLGTQIATIKIELFELREMITKFMGRKITITDYFSPNFVKNIHKGLKFQKSTLTLLLYRGAYSAPPAAKLKSPNFFEVTRIVKLVFK